MIETKNEAKPRLVKAEKLRLAFDPPVSLRHIRDLQYRKCIPYLKIGSAVWFDVDQVLDVLHQNHEVKAARG